jgi:hypothetical protein
LGDVSEVITSVGAGAGACLLGVGDAGVAARAR